MTNQEIADLLDEAARAIDMGDKLTDRKAADIWKRLREAADAMRATKEG